MNFPPPTERQARVIWLALTGLAAAVLAGLALVPLYAFYSLPEKRGISSHWTDRSSPLKSWAAVWACTR